MRKTRKVHVASLNSCNIHFTFLKSSKGPIHILSLSQYTAQLRVVAPLTAGEVASNLVPSPVRSRCFHACLETPMQQHACLPHHTTRHICKKLVASSTWTASSSCSANRSWCAINSPMLSCELLFAA